MGRAQSTKVPREELNGICPYYTMFPLSFPMAQLRKATPGDWVLDPFCGRGTTTFAARLLGLPTVGVDSNPVAAAIAEAKLAPATASEVIATCEQIIAEAPEPNDRPDSEFWDLLFHPDTFTQVCQLREALRRDCRSSARKVLRAFLLGRLHGPLRKDLPTYLSNQMPRTFAAKPGYAVKFWRQRGLSAPKVDVLELVRRKVSSYLDQAPKVVDGRVICADSREVDLATLGGPFSWVITSPPYYGMRTYIPDQWLRSWFLGGPSKVSYTMSGQMTHRSPDSFARDLAKVWQNVAQAASPGARMVIRFGGIRDRNSNPREMLRQSLVWSDAPWRLMTVKSAGLASRGRRQARQFGLELQSPIEELDFYVRLV